MPIDQLELDHALGHRRFQRYAEDCARIVKVARDNGAALFHRDAERIWEWHSDSQCATWLSLRTDEEILAVIQRFIAHRNGY